METPFLWKITFILASIFLFFMIIIQLTVIYYIHKSELINIINIITLYRRNLLQEIIKFIDKN